MCQEGLLSTSSAAWCCHQHSTLSHCYFSIFHFLFLGFLLSQQPGLWLCLSPQLPKPWIYFLHRCGPPRQCLCPLLRAAPALTAQQAPPTHIPLTVYVQCIPRIVSGRFSLGSPARFLLAQPYKKRGGCIFIQYWSCILNYLDQNVC